MAADGTYQGTGLQRRQDGTTAIPSGGSLDIESGGALKLAGTALAITAAQLNALATAQGEDITATADGTGTGTIAGAGLITFVAITSAGANNIVVLPAPTPGRIVIGYVGANGCELRSSAPATVAINGGSGAAAESAIAANMMFVAICTSATTWHGFTITAATLAALEAAA